MNYLSICSGIEAATVAWHPLGWSPVAFAEIEPFPSAVLAHHWPDVPNLGDLTKHHDWTDRISTRPDLIVGGTPCQAFSVAGLRKGLDDPRGNLTLIFLGLLDQFRPRWVVWENVPGVLSDRTGAFGAFLGGLGELGYGFAYRVLDAQFYGVPQRRRRVFVVGYLGDWRRAAAVLFEPESLRGDSPPSRETGQGDTGDAAARSHWSGGAHPSLNRGGCGGIGMSNQEIFSQQGAWLVPAVANPLTARMHKGVNSTMDEGQTMIPTVFEPRFARNGCGAPSETCPTLTAHSRIGDSSPCIAFETRFVRNGRGAPSDVVPPLKAQSGQTGKGDASPCVAYTLHGSDKTVSTATPTDTAGSIRTKPPGSIENSSTTVALHRFGVRRLTPVECERLQGFPDDHSRIPWRGKDSADCPDGPRYKALGNSMAVPVMRWIGRRIQSLTESKP